MAGIASAAAAAALPTCPLCQAGVLAVNQALLDPRTPARSRRGTCEEQPEPACAEQDDWAAQQPSSGLLQTQPSKPRARVWNALGLVLVGLGRGGGQALSQGRKAAVAAAVMLKQGAGGLLRSHKALRKGTEAARNISQVVRRLGAMHRTWRELRDGVYSAALRVRAAAAGGAAAALQTMQDIVHQEKLLHPLPRLLLCGACLAVVWAAWGGAWMRQRWQGALVLALLLDYVFCVAASALGVLHGWHVAKQRQQRLASLLRISAEHGVAACLLLAAMAAAGPSPAPSS